MQVKRRGRGRAELPDKAGLESHTAARNPCPGRIKKRKGRIIPPEFDPDMVQDPIRLLFDGLKRRLGQ